MSAGSPLLYLIIVALVLVVGYAVFRVRHQYVRRTHYRRKTKL